MREEALACYEQALLSSPQLADGWLARATVLYELKRLPEATRAVERFLEVAPEDHRELLTGQMMLKELERAGGKVAGAAAPASPDAPPARERKRSDRTTGMKSVRNTGRTSDPGSARKSDRQPGKKSDRTTGRKSIRAEKKSMRSESRAAKRSGRMSAVPAAPAPVTIADKVDSRSDGLTAEDIATFDEVRALCLGGRHVEALRKLEPIAKRCMESAEAWLLRAHILFALKQYEPALTSAERAARLDASDLEAARLTVRVLVAMKKDDRALVAADRLLTLVPRDPEAHRARADCLVVLMRQAEAVFAYEKVIHYAPDDAAAWFGLGRTLRQLRRFSEARMALTKAVSLGEVSAPDVVAQAKEIMAKLPPQ